MSVPLPLNGRVPTLKRVVRIAAPPSSGLPPFDAVIDAVTVERLGVSWRAGCPVAPDQLRLITLNRVGFDGRVHRGQLVVAADLAAEVAHIFADLYFARFPIERMDTVEKLGADDERSMAANNTSAFNCRPVTGASWGSGRWSNHSYGRAIDINPVQNPYVSCDGTVLPAAAAPYVDRTRGHPGLVRADGPTVHAFERRGWHWGGRWTGPVDHHHFEKP